ncbi:MAG: glycosyltransferase [Deltaproteobacteria bacterium]|jgi:hypothetical protein|nr:glycosyltransferase [Deltaproteobacteria bacterium]
MPPWLKSNLKALAARDGALADALQAYLAACPPYLAAGPAGEEIYYFAEETPRADDAPFTEDAPLTKGATLAKDATITKNAPFTEEATRTENATITKDAPLAKGATITKNAPFAEEATLAKDATITKNASFTEEATLTKDAPFTEEATLTKDATRRNEAAPLGTPAPDAARAVIPTRVKLSRGASDFPLLSLEGERAFTLNGRDPAREDRELFLKSVAARRARSPRGDKPPARVGVLGFGLGYLLEDLLREYPQAAILVWEASLPLLAAALSARSLEKALSDPRLTIRAGHLAAPPHDPKSEIIARPMALRAMGERYLPFLYDPTLFFPASALEAARAALDGPATVGNRGTAPMENSEPAPMENGRPAPAETRGDALAENSGPAPAGIHGTAPAGTSGDAPGFSPRGVRARRTARGAKILFCQSGYYLDREIQRASQSVGASLETWPLWDYRDLTKDREKDYKELLARIKSFRPDLFLTVNHIGFDEDGILSGILARLGIPAASWFVDSPAYILSGARLNPYPGLAAFSWDSAYLDYLREAGFPSVNYLPLASEESFFARGAASPFPALDLTFVGDSLEAATGKYLRLAGLSQSCLPALDAIAERFLEEPNLLFPDSLLAAFQRAPFPGSDPLANPGADPRAEPGGNPRAEPGAALMVDPRADPGADPSSDPGAALRVDPRADPGADLRADPRSDPGAALRVDPRADPGANPRAEPGADPEAASLVEPATDNLADHSLSPLPGRGPQGPLSALVTWRASRAWRRNVLRLMPPELLTVAGDEGWRELLPEARLMGPVDYYRELPSFYRASKVSLNITSAQMKSGLNQRVFDAPAAGGFLLTDRRSQAQGLFTEGVDIAQYGDPQEARELALFYLQNDAAREKILRAAQATVFREHLYRHRLPQLVRATLRG